MNYTVNGTTYAYHISGEGQPVVFLHGFTGSRETWDKITKTLGKDLQIITIDLPGHGETAFQKDLSMEACCYDLEQLFTYLKLSNIHLVGYSMGGRLALTFTILYPENISSLTLESASPGLQLKSEREARVKQDENLANKIEKDGLQTFVDFWEGIPLFQSQKHLATEIQEKIRNERLNQTTNGLATSLRLMGTGTQPSWWEQIHELNLPVLLIVGELDKKFVQINNDMHDLLPLSQIEVIENTGHAVHIEQPLIFSQLILRFISVVKDNY